LASFVHLKTLCITTCGDAYLKRSDFQNLSQSRISTLILDYTGFAPLKGISLMVNLTTLVVRRYCSGMRGDGSWYMIPTLHDTQVPREIGLLYNLKKLTIRGAYDDIPLEITNLQQHGTQVDVDPF
jgi:hypothetical protein